MEYYARVCFLSAVFTSAMRWKIFPSRETEGLARYQIFQPISK